MAYKAHLKQGKHETQIQREKLLPALGESTCPQPDPPASPDRQCTYTKRLLSYLCKDKLRSQKLGYWAWYGT